MVNILPKLSQKTPHRSPVRVMYGVSFVGSKSGLHSASALQWCMEYHVILYHVKTAPDCTYPFSQFSSVSKKSPLKIVYILMWLKFIYMCSGCVKCFYTQDFLSQACHPDRRFVSATHLKITHQYILTMVPDLQTSCSDLIRMGGCLESTSSGQQRDRPYLQISGICLRKIMW